MNNDERNAKLQELLLALSGLMDKLDTIRKASEQHEGATPEESERMLAEMKGNGAVLTVEARDEQGNVKDRMHETYDTGSETGMPMKVLTKLLLGISPELALPMSQLLMPIREDIVGLVIGQRRAEGIMVVTFKLHHSNDCDCPPELNFVTMMHHPRYKDSDGEQFTGVLTIGQYNTIDEAIDGHAQWQEKLSTMDTALLPDVIEGTYDPTENERVTLFRHDVHTTIQ